MSRPQRPIHFTREQVESLAIACRTDPDRLGELWELLLPLVVQMAWKWGIPREDVADELSTDLLLCLQKCVRYWDSNHKTKFTTYFTRALYVLICEARRAAARPTRRILTDADDITALDDIAAPIPYHEATPAAIAEARDSLANLPRLAERLTPRQMQVFEVLWQGGTHRDQVDRIMQLAGYRHRNNASTAISRTQQALRKLEAAQAGYSRVTDVEPVA